jgi:hypothetical protein
MSFFSPGQIFKHCLQQWVAKQVLDQRTPVSRQFLVAHFFHALARILLASLSPVILYGTFILILCRGCSASILASQGCAPPFSHRWCWCRVRCRLLYSFRRGRVPPWRPALVRGRFQRTPTRLQAALIDTRQEPHLLFQDRTSPLLFCSKIAADWTAGEQGIDWVCTVGGRHKDGQGEQAGGALIPQVAAMPSSRRRRCLRLYRGLDMEHRNTKEVSLWFRS